MTISALAKASGVNAKLIRHYESIGLVATPKRNSSGYRTYTQKDVHFLKFVGRARGAGFELRDIKKFLSLWRNNARSSSDARRIAQRQIENIERKIKELRCLSTSFKELEKSCGRNVRSAYPSI